MTTKSDRYKGALVSVLCGDALGAPYETWGAKSIQQDLAKRGGLVPFDYLDPWKRGGIFPKGRPTDDSDHTAALAQSLVACRGVDQADIFLRLRNVTFEHKSPLWDGKAVGAGSTMRKMLRPTTWRESQALGCDGAFPSNGSLMRAAPLALFFGSAGTVCSHIVRDASEVTHRHPLATECCIAYSIVLAGLLEGREPVDCIASAHMRVMDAELVAVLHDPTSPPRDPEVWPGRGAALLTLHVALYALMRARTFRDGLTEVVAVGGDTDTYGAVAGGLLGARFSINAIPSEWKDILIGRSVMEDAAHRLLHIACKEGYML